MLDIGMALQNSSKKGPILPWFFGILTRKRCIRNKAIAIRLNYTQEIERDKVKLHQSEWESQSVR